MSLSSAEHAPKSEGVPELFCQHQTQVTAGRTVLNNVEQLLLEHVRLFLEP